MHVTGIKSRPGALWAGVPAPLVSHGETRSPKVPLRGLMYKSKLGNQGRTFTACGQRIFFFPFFFFCLWVVRERQRVLAHRG